MWLKWLFDRSVALVGLILISPVLLVVAILVRIKMPDGPVLFRQKRVGKNGRLFTINKFRTMSISHGGSSVSVAGESRITPLGARLRHYKLDELPELWNVLIGDMSFVGPRPWVMDYWNNMNAEERERSRVLPGITGLAQVKGRNGISIFKKIEWDLTYVRNYSLWQDFKVILLTIFTVFSGSGVDAGKEGMRDDIKDLRGR